jgi:hypothetical protein
MEAACVPGTVKKARGDKAGEARRVHPHAWLWEALEDDATFVLASMFGIRVAYLDGLMMLGFAAKEDPWRGLLVCTERAQHASLMAEFPDLEAHPILGKWLYLPESADDFEKTGSRIVELARGRDPRIGVLAGRKRKERP